jgi:deoxycytidine triphosphate deaminase
MSIDISEEADPNYRQNIDRYVIPSTPTPISQDPNFQIIRLVVATVDDTEMDPYGEVQYMMDEPKWHTPEDFE